MSGVVFKVLRERSFVARRSAIVSITSSTGVAFGQSQNSFIGATRFKSAAAASSTAKNLVPAMEITPIMGMFEAVPKAHTTLRGGKQSSAIMRYSQIIDCKPVNEGKQLELTFADQSRYRLHTAWIKDSSPANTGKDYYRKSAADVWKVSSFKISQALAVQDGNALAIEFTNTDGSIVKDEFNAKFL